MNRSTGTETPSARFATSLRQDVAFVVVLLCVVGALTLQWSGRYVWTPDALFYEAKLQQVRGESREAALNQVWTGPLSRGFRLDDATRPPAARALSDPEWIPYTYGLFDRRWLTPLLGAAAYPLFHTDSLEFVSVLGVFVFAVALYGLLRLRFTPGASVIACVFCLAWPPLRWGFMPLADSWSLALETLALGAAVLVIDRSMRWLPLWIGVVLTATVTRDITPVLLGAGLGLALILRTRRAAILAASGVLAALPAPLIFGASVRDQIAYTFSGNRVPHDTSWGFIAGQYLPHVQSALNDTWSYLTASDPRYLPGYGGLLIPLAVPLLIGVVIVLAMRAWQPDALLAVIRGAMLGGVAYLLILPHFSLLRYELVFLPVAGVGIAVAVEALLGRLRPTRRSSEPPPPTPA